MTTTRMTKRIQLSIGQTVDTEPRSRRMKVYQLHNPGMVHRLQRLARQDDIDKILFYVKREQIPRLIGTGCVFEGYIHGFFRGETAYIFSLFLNPDRNHPVSHDQQRRVMNLVKNDHKKNRRLVSSRRICDEQSRQSGYPGNGPSL